VLRLSGAGIAASLAGCIGGLGGGDGGGTDEEYLAAAEGLGLGENWEARRIGAADGWPVEARQDVPHRANDTTWTGVESFESSVENDVWTPPDGWEETAAGDVETMQILNHGAANMEFDPTTLAAHEMFEEQTGIELDVIEIGVDQGNTREQQFLSSGDGQPYAFNVDGILVPVFVQQGYLEVTDVLYPSGAYEPYIPALRSLVEWDLDATREGPTPTAIRTSGRRAWDTSGRTSSRNRGSTPHGSRASGPGTCSRSWARRSREPT
jgi:multiple sugar transport system substrate-binding protein